MDSVSFARGSPTDWRKKIYLCVSLQVNAIVQQLQHHLNMTFFGGQVQPVKPILRIQEKTLGAEKVSQKKKNNKKNPTLTHLKSISLSLPVYLSNYLLRGGQPKNNTVKH